MDEERSGTGVRPGGRTLPPEQAKVLDPGAVDDKHDLSVFQEANKNKIPLQERQKLIAEKFPDTKDFNWKKAFDNDLDLFARIIRDILKLDQAQPGRPGPRPSIDYGDGVRRLRQFMGQDYALLPFHEAFRILAGDRSVRSLASKLGIDRNQVHRLLTGKVYPGLYDIEVVAKAFGKHPSYFLEYRIQYIANS